MSAQPISDGHRGVWQSVASALVRAFYQGYWTVLIAFALPFLWAHNWSSLLYGEDSFRLLNPFSFNNDPVIQYSYLYSASFPIPNNTAYFFTDSATYLLQRVGLPYPIVERLFVGLLCATGAAGVVLLLSNLNELNGLPRTSNPTGKMLCALVYLMNPFTLSVIWWHFENWGYFLVLLPFLGAFLLELTYFRKVSTRRVCGTLLLGVLLSPGVTGSFAFGTTVIFTVFIFALVGRTLIQDLPIRKFLVRFGAIIVGWAILVLPLVVPFLFVPNSAYTENASYLTASNLFSVFSSESLTTCLLNVMRLVAFTWIYEVPSAYPWSGYSTTVISISYCIPFIVILGALFIRRVNGLLPLYASALIVVALSVGANPPFGSLNRALLGLGGPFLVLVNPYYLVGEVYVLLLPLALYVLLALYSGRDVRLVAHYLYDRLRKLTDRMISLDAADQVVSGARRTIRPTLPVSFQTRSLRTSVTTVPKVLTIGGLLVVAALGFPFFAGEVYQPSGGNIDEFNLPPSFDALQDFFGSISSGPVYNVLVLPLSASTAVYLSFENESFTDSSLLLSSFVPYPLIQMDTGPVVSDFEDYLAANQSNSLVPVLDSMSVRFVVLNPFANASEYWMSHAPDGLPIDYPAVQARIAAELGPSQSAGAFTVYENLGALPIVRVGTQLPSLTTPSYPQFLSTLGDLNSIATPIARNLSESTWENGSCASFSDLCAVQVPQYSVSVTIPQDDSFAIVSSGGGVSEYNGSSPSGLPEGFTFFDANRSLVASPSLRATISNLSSIDTDLSVGNNSLQNSQGSTGYVEFKGNLSVPSLASMALSIGQLDPNDWVSATFSSNLVQLLVQVYLNTSNNAVTFTEAAYYMDRAYAWNVVTSTGLDNGSAIMRVTVYPTSLSAAVWETSRASQQLPSLNFSGTGIRSNEGYNTSLEPAIPVVFGNFTARLTIVNAATDVSAFAISTPVNARDIVIANGTSDFMELPAIVTMEPSGNFRVECLSILPSSKVVVWLNYPVNSLWTATSSQFAISKLDGAPYANAFLAVPIGPGSLGNDTITLVMNVSLNVGLYVDFGLALLLGSVLGATLLIPMVARRKSPRPLAPTSSAGPSEARQPADGHMSFERNSDSPDFSKAEAQHRE